MKKITLNGENTFVSVCQQGACILATIAVFFLLCLVDITPAAAQGKQNDGVTGTGNALAVADRGMSTIGSSLAPSRYAYTAVDNGPSAADENERIPALVKEIRVYPNPVSDYLLVMIPAAAKANIPVIIRGMDGKTITKDEIAAGTANAVIDVKQIPAGMYVVSIGDVADRLVRLARN